MTWKKIKCCLTFTLIVFVVGGLWFPILSGANFFDIQLFLISGISAIALLWGGGSAAYLLTREKTTE